MQTLQMYSKYVRSEVQGPLDGRVTRGSVGSQPLKRCVGKFVHYVREAARDLHRAREQTAIIIIIIR